MKNDSQSLNLGLNLDENSSQKSENSAKFEVEKIDE